MNFCTRNVIISILQVVFFWLSPLASSAQLQAGACVHSSGISYLLDGYLAAIGACDCERAGVFANSYYSCDKNPYILTFEDDFNGDSLDLTKWQLVMASQGALSNSQRIELSTLNNAVVSEGSCKIIARKETVVARAVNWKPDDEILKDGLPNLRTFYYTSSALWSREQYLHGKYEIRCKLPSGNGFWPAFWMFGGKRWNEIDVFDNYKGIEKLVTSIGHDFDGEGRANGCSISYSGYDLSEWHTFTCVFEPAQISFLIDGNLVRIIPRLLTSSGAAVNCDDNLDAGNYFELKSFPVEPMNIIFNLALTSENGPGGSLPVSDATPLPGVFEVDYIRYWKRKPSEVMLFPNPTTDNIKVVLTSGEITSIRVLNPLGQIVMSSELSGQELNFSLGALKEGVYFFETGYEGGRQIEKVILLGK